MKTFFSIIGSIFIDIARAVYYFITNNLRNFAKFLNFALPYVMYLIGQYVRNQRGMLSVGGEIFIPLIFCILIFFIKSYANKIGKGTTIPIPNKRFTVEDDDGEVSIENRRIQELILYTADLEDWLERKGLLWGDCYA